MKNLKFNWAEKQFELENYNPKVVWDQEDDKAWVEQYIRIERGAYPLYSSNYGINKYGVFQYRLPAAVAISEINRQLLDAKTFNDHIEFIGNARIDEDKNVAVDLQLKDY